MIVKDPRPAFDSPEQIEIIDMAQVEMPPVAEEPTTDAPAKKPKKASAKKKSKKAKAKKKGKKHQPLYDRALDRLYPVFVGWWRD